MLIQMTYKKILIILALVFCLPIKSFANTEDDILKEDIYKAIEESVDGRLIYQAHIKTLYGLSDIDIYMANSYQDFLPAASTIKTMIGLSLLEKAQNGQIEYTDAIKDDLDLSLRISDNDATNRLIEELGGFGEVNSYIESLTSSDRTRLNRFMLGSGDENTANAKDLSKALFEIFLSDAEIGEDMRRSLENSSTKRAKLLKDINPSYESMNKTGELNYIENDMALVQTGSNAFIISLLTQNDNYMDHKSQIKLINKLGSDVTKAYEKYQEVSREKEKRIQENLIKNLDTDEKRLAYGIYKNQISINAAKILLDSDLESIDEIRSDLENTVARGQMILDEAKRSLAIKTDEDISTGDDMAISLIRLVYTNKERNSDINRDLALAFYKNKSSAKAAEIILTKAPRASLPIRKSLLASIKKSEENFVKMDKYFQRINAEN